MFNIQGKKSLFFKTAVVLFAACFLELMLFMIWENTVAALKGNSVIINMVGAERVRLLKIAFLAENYDEGIEQDAGAKTELDKEINLFEDILFGLRDGNQSYNLKKQDSPEIIAKLNQNIDKWNKSVKPMFQNMLFASSSENNPPVSPFDKVGIKGKLKDYRQEIFTYLDDINGLVMLFKIPSEKKINRLRQLQIAFLFLSGLIVLGSLIALYSVIIKPIKKLNVAVTAAASGDISQTVPVLYGDEIGMLSTSFNTMTYHIKTMTDSLKESEEKFRSMVERNFDAIHIIDMDGIFIYSSPAVERVAGYKPDEIIGKHFKHFIAETDIPKASQAFCDMASSKTLEMVELKAIRKDGDPFIIEANGSPVFKNGKIIAIQVVYRDITEKKMLGEQLIHSQKMEAIGQLASGIAHDFNNILTAIIGYGTLLIRKKPDDNLVKEYTGEIITSANRAAVLTRDLLTFSRKHAINPQPALLNELVKMVERILARVIGEHIELKVTLADKNLIVKMDTTQIEQVFLNLAANARDAMPEGGKLTIDVSRVKLDNDLINNHDYGIQGQYALITFADTGIGIDKNIQSRIFEPFFTTKEVGKGTGLGLSMVYGIIKQHNGYINVYSEPGQGTAFKIYLPLLEKGVLGKKKETEAAAPKGNMETILVAEDDPDSRITIKAVLEEYNYKVIEAVDGIDAISKFTDKKDEINLLILDMIMPRLNGRQAYEGIKKLDLNIKAIFISGYTADVIKAKDLLKPGFVLLPKPIAPNELLTKIREALDK
ncbi:MAG: PAS domain S-box protein [Deltaproteobacteria bacterium]|nr:PAS domain S-box protein [Deltaproteobacteria bacterium]